MTETNHFENKRLAVVGAGKRAEALVRGALAAGLLEAGQVTAADPSEARREVFASLGAEATANNAEAVAAADVVVLAVKPQQLETAVAELALAAAGKLFISIVAGARSKRIASALGAGARIVRTMPNTPLLVGAGATAISAGPGATAANMELVRDLFGASGRVFELPEETLDAVTAVGGSGPAYLFYLAEAMIAAARAEGLDEEIAVQLVAATLRGSAQLLEKSDQPAEELRRQVTSPGGTTAAALKVLEDGGVKDKLVAAVRRAAERSRELAGR